MVGNDSSDSDIKLFLFCLPYSCFLHLLNYRIQMKRMRTVMMMQTTRHPLVQIFQRKMERIMK